MCWGSCGHTHRVGSSQGGRLPLWLTLVLQGRSGCAAQGHPVCGEHSWSAWKSPAQSASFSLHSCCRPPPPARDLQSQPLSFQLTALSKGCPHPHWPSLIYTTAFTPDLNSAELSSAWEENCSSARVTESLFTEGESL